MIELERTVVIACPAARVFDYLTEVDNIPAYIGPVHRVLRVTTPKLVTGTRLTIEATFLGITFSQRAECAEHARPRRFVARSVGGRFSFEAGFELSEANGSTVVAGWGIATAPGLFALADGLMEFLIGRQVDGDLKRLKRRLEQSA